MIGRRLATIGIGLLLGASNALAADQHFVELLGYSGDGRYFAFEEFGAGLDDASRVMSRISIIDLRSGADAPGSPFVSGGGEDDELIPTRASAAALAAPAMRQLGISVPAQYVGDGVAGASGAARRFGQPQSGYGAGANDDRLLTLDTFAPAGNPPACGDGGAPAKGFALAVSAGGPLHEVYRDAVVPASRGCVLDYRLYGVALPINNDMQDAVAVVSVLTGGFEGYDRSFLAVPIGN